MPTEHLLSSMRLSRRRALVLAAFGLLFLALGGAVAGGIAVPADRAILTAMRVPGHPELLRGPPWMPGTVGALSSLGSPVVLWLVILLAGGGLAACGPARRAAVAVATMAFGMTLAGLFKIAFDRARPEVVPHLAYVQSRSFPSGHASDSAVVYLTLALLAAGAIPRGPARGFVLAAGWLLVMAIGSTRILLGVHWPSDVIAGWALGGFWAILMNSLGRRFGSDREPCRRSSHSEGSGAP